VDAQACRGRPGAINRAAGCRCARTSARVPRIGAAGSVLRSKHTDSGAVADFMDAVEDVDDIEPDRGRLKVMPFELVRDAGIDLRTERKMAGIGEVVFSNHSHRSGQC